MVMEILTGVFFDNLRPGYNKSPAQNRLHLDENVAEDPDRVDDGQGIDILSNGLEFDQIIGMKQTHQKRNIYLLCLGRSIISQLVWGSSNAR